MSTTRHSHGPQFDEFARQTGNPHGAQFDEFSRPKDPTSMHGKLFDKFAKRPGVDRYGERWDEFGWKDMPPQHGQRFDEGFDRPTAHDTEHGTWFDEFRGGTQVRYMADGSDYEGTVVDCKSTHLIVEPKEGGRHELHMGQIMAYRAPGDVDRKITPASQVDIKAEEGGMDAPTRHSPSDSASGGSITDRRTPVNVDALTNSTFANKTADERLDLKKALTIAEDVAKSNRMGVTRLHHLPDSPCSSCGSTFAHVWSHRDHGESHHDINCAQCGTLRHSTYAGNPKPASVQVPSSHPDHAKFKAHQAASDRLYRASHTYALGDVADSGHGKALAHFTEAHKAATQAFKALPKTPTVPIGKSLADAVDVLKDVDSTETALEREPGSDTAQGHSWCKKCQHYCRKVVEGKCPTCGGPVSSKPTDTTQKTSVGKTTLPGALDVLKAL